MGAYYSLFYLSLLSQGGRFADTGHKALMPGVNNH